MRVRPLRRCAPARPPSRQKPYGLRQHGKTGRARRFPTNGNGFPASTVSPYGATTTNTYTIYSGASSPTTVTSQTNNHYSQQTLDGVGHVVKQVTGTVSGSTYTPVSEVDSVYAPCACSPMGKLQKVSQPYTPGSGSPVWTTYAYDWLGRTTSVTLPDNSVTQYIYDDMVAGTDPPASYVRVIDPALKQKRYQMDRFGHLTRAVEDPTGLAYATTYTYDVLDHLTQVQQTRGSTTQTRTFNYKSGTTLTPFLQSATNPENGTVTYTYNSNNLLATKTDAKGVVTEYNYDSQNRLLSFGVLLGGTFTPAYTYVYDSANNGTNQTGRLASISYGAAAADQVVETYSYTAPGETSVKDVMVTRSGSSAHLTLDYTYDSEGHRSSMTTPMRTFNFTYDAMERATGMNDTGGNTYVNGVQYGPANQLLGISYTGTPGGALLGETRTYNSLLQLTSIYTSYVSLTYAYTAGQDNGKIASTTNGITGEVVQYTYDSLNRLIQAQATSNSWGQAFVYDGFGNLYQKNVTAGSAPSMQYTVNAATNQLTGNGLGYDANGNMTNPPSGGTLTYDFLNRVVAMTGGVAYSYDASNRRVWKQNSSGQEYYLYGLDGENLGTYTPVLGGSPAQLSFTLASGQERDYFFGKKLFTTEDNVGSAEGAPGHGPTTFYPYGEQKSGTTSEQYGFATYWEDSESGLDYAMNRYYSSTLGRFLSPDPYSGSMNRANPQSFNRYAYVENDPVNGNDPTGQFLGLPPDPGPSSFMDFDQGSSCESLYGDPWDEFEATGSFSSMTPLIGAWCLPFNFQNPWFFVNPNLGGGGGGAGAGNPKVNGISGAATALKYELNHLGSNCQKVLPSASTLAADASNLVYYDGRVQPSTPISSIPGAVPSQPGATLATELQANGGDSNAVILLGPNGTLSNDIDLGSGFFAQNAATQGITLLPSCSIMRLK